MRSTRLIPAIAALALAAAAAQAQDAPRIELGIEGGSVLVSTGGEFAQASGGQDVAPGDRILVSEGASASLTYANGCQKSLSTAGVYTVSADCDAGAGGGSGGSPSAGVVAAVAGGVAVIAAAAGGGGGSDRAPPVSR